MVEILRLELKPEHRRHPGARGRVTLTDWEEWPTRWEGISLLNPNSWGVYLKTFYQEVKDD